jgi:hypothetical protein
MDRPEEDEPQGEQPQLMTEEEFLASQANAPAAQTVYEHPDEDVRSVDNILRNVGMRSSVYAHEILDNLPDNPLSVYYHEQLSANVAHIQDGTKLLHSREYLDMLLDFRNLLTEAYSENNKEAEIPA